MMAWRYGSYSSTPGAARVLVSQRAVKNKAEVPYYYDTDIAVSGRIYGTGEDGCQAAEVALRAALITPFQDFAFLKSSGAPSAVYFRNSQSFGGVLISEGPDFTGTQSAEHVSFREYSFKVKVGIPVKDIAAIVYLDFSESIEFSGGGPEFVMKRAVNGLPQKQLVWKATEYRAVQTGTISGFKNIPPLPPQVFPGNLKKSPTVNQMAPKRIGNTLYDYTLRYSYEYESSSPLVGVPTVWRP